MEGFIFKRTGGKVESLDFIEDVGNLDVKGVV
jgi:hypothetical protein